MRCFEPILESAPQKQLLYDQTIQVRHAVEILSDVMRVG